MVKKFIVTTDFHDTRLDRWFKKNVFDIPQSLIQKLTRKNQIKVNGRKVKTSYRVKSNDEIQTYSIEKIKPKSLSKTNKYLPSKAEKEKYGKLIIENNDNFIVINKPRGIPVQSGTRSYKNIIDILKNTNFFEKTKPYIVHRLDKETSGVMIVAKNRKYAQLLTTLFRLRKIHKTYVAITHGEMPSGFDILKDNLSVVINGKNVEQKAISYLKVLKRNNKFSLLELKPITGRKHQLRKQLYNIGYPIVGDTKYFIQNNKKKLKNSNLLLHAFKIKFMINGIKYNFKARYGDEFNNFIKKF